jgi:hypothetical protein
LYSGYTDTLMQRLGAKLIGMRVIEEPFTTRNSILGVLRPGGIPTEGIFRTLRTKGLVSPGVRVEPRTSRGRILGKASFYSALNMDAARAVRLGHPDIALQFAERAARLEQSNDAMTIRDAVQTAAGVTTELSGDAAVPMSVKRLARRGRGLTLDGLDDSALRQLWLVRSETWMNDEQHEQLSDAAVALATGAAVARREILGDADTSATTFFGVVRRLNQSAAEIESADEVQLTPRADLEREGLADIGQPVALLCEALPAGGTFSFPMPALALDGSDGEQRESPFHLKELTPGEVRFDHLTRRDVDWIVDGPGVRVHLVPAAPLTRG